MRAQTFLLASPLLLIALSSGCGSTTRPPVHAAPDTGAGGEPGAVAEEEGCSALEGAYLSAELEGIVEHLSDLEGDDLDEASAAAAAIGELCLASHGDRRTHVPVASRRDDAWLQRCGGAEPAIPALIRVLETVQSRRSAKSPENTPGEDDLVNLTVQALGGVLTAVPRSACRADGVAALISAAETPDVQQDLRINLAAIYALGAIGDSAAIPVLVRSIFMVGTRRPVALQEIGRTAIQQIHDLEAVTVALVRAGRMEDEALCAMQQADAEMDVRLIKEQVAITLGQIGHPSPLVIEYLTAEMMHAEIDDFDRTASRGSVTFYPSTSSAYRRMWGTSALARMGHPSALEPLLARVAVRDQQLVHDQTEMIEVPGYLDALGDLLEPARTNAVLLPWAEHGDDALRDRAGRRLALQGDGSLAERLDELASTMEVCATAADTCLRSNFEHHYAAVLVETADCSGVQCWIGHLSSRSEHIRERAAYQLVMAARSDPADAARARAALLPLLEDDVPEVSQAAVFAIDHLSPDGCDAACLSGLDEIIASLRGRGSRHAAHRAAMALRARLSFRGRLQPGD